MGKIYEKTPLIAEELIQKLESKGLIIKSKVDAINSLKNIGYYRLSSYFLAFKNFNIQGKPFNNKTTFEDILNLYSFDKELRLLVLDPIETIEVALRSSLIDVMSLKYGIHWYVKKDLFKKHKNFSIFQKEVDSICNKAKESFLRHYYKNYEGPKYPPSWMIIECLFFGSCTQLLMNIKALQDRKDVCAIFKHHPTIIESWFSAMSATRNLCAHHSRLWNRWFSFVPIHPYEELIPAKKHSFGEQASVIIRMLNAISKAKSSDWKGKIYNLFEKYPNIPKQNMGFVFDWRNDPFWDG